MKIDSLIKKTKLNNRKYQKKNNLNAYFQLV
jgi:hypothetical protein